MDSVKFVTCIACCTTLLIAGCASSPEAEARRLQTRASIAEILSQPLDPAEYGETKRCLSETEYRSFRAIDDQHILFKGRGDRLYMNTLRAPCHDLRYGDVLVVRQFSPRRMCDSDTFSVTDWFNWPWYRRWPWYWHSGWGTGMRCTLGKFQPVTQQQVDEIEAVLDSH